MVSAVSGTELRSPKQRRIYTIYDLNMVYRNRFPQYYDDLKKDPFLPSALRVQFNVPEFWEYGNSPC